MADSIPLPDLLVRVVQAVERGAFSEFDGLGIRRKVQAEGDASITIVGIYPDDGARRLLDAVDEHIWWPDLQELRIDRSHFPAKIQSVRDAVEHLLLDSWKTSSGDASRLLRILKLLLARIGQAGQDSGCPSAPGESAPAVPERPNGSAAAVAAWNMLSRRAREKWIKAAELGRGAVQTAIVRAVRRAAGAKVSETDRREFRELERGGVLSSLGRRAGYDILLQPPSADATTTLPPSRPPVVGR